MRATYTFLFGNQAVKHVVLAMSVAVGFFCFSLFHFVSYLFAIYSGFPRLYVISHLMDTRNVVLSLVVAFLIVQLFLVFGYLYGRTYGAHGEVGHLVSIYLYGRRRLGFVFDAIIVLQLFFFSLLTTFLRPLAYVALVYVVAAVFFHNLYRYKQRHHRRDHRYPARDHETHLE
jgi:hypothetical protein